MSCPVEETCPIIDEVVESFNRIIVEAIEQIAGMIPNLKVEIIEPVLVKGCPRENDRRKEFIYSK